MLEVGRHWLPVIVGRVFDRERQAARLVGDHAGRMTGRVLDNIIVGEERPGIVVRGASEKRGRGKRGGLFFGG
jgi:hypothetical protein